MDPGFRMYCRQISDGFTAFWEWVVVVAVVGFTLRLIMHGVFMSFLQGVALINMVGVVFFLLLEEFPGSVQHQNILKNNKKRV